MSDQTVDEDVTTKNDTAPQTKNADLIDRLRERTRGEHRNVEAIEFNVRIMKGEISRREYATLLECHLIIHEALDNLMATHRDPRVAAVFRPEQIKTTRLEADLRALELPATPRDADPIARARGLAQTITWLGDDAGCALGFFYVFEGSTMGGMVMRKRFADALDLDDDMLNFYGAYGRETAMKWRATCGRFNAAELRRAEIDRAVGAANLAFLEIGHMLQGF